MMTNTECNSIYYLLNIYYTVQVESCYNVAYMCTASSRVVSSAVCVVQVPSEEVWQYHGLIYYCLLKQCG